MSDESNVETVFIGALTDEELALLGGGDGAQIEIDSTTAR